MEEEGDLFSNFSQCVENDTYFTTKMEKGKTKNSPPRKITPVPYNPSLTILLEVFLFLERNTIESIQIVCRYWDDIIIRNHSILPIYLFERLKFYTYKRKPKNKIETNMILYSRFLKKGYSNLIDSTKNQIDFSRIKSLKYGLFKYCDLRDESKEILQVLKRLYDILGEKINVHEIIFNDFELLKDCIAYIKVNEARTSIKDLKFALLLEHPIPIHAKKIEISISYPLSIFYNDLRCVLYNNPGWPNDAYDSTLIKENTTKFIDLIQNNEVYGINRFSFKFDDSDDIINEVPNFCENLMEIFMNAKDPTTVPRSIEIRRDSDFIPRYRPTHVSGNIPFSKLINEQNFKKQYDTGRYTHSREKKYFFKKIYEIKTKNEFVLRLGVEYVNREYIDDADRRERSEENLFKSAKMKLLLTE